MQAPHVVAAGRVASRRGLAAQLRFGGWKPMQTSRSDVRSEIADLTGLSLADLEELPDTVLTASLRRILRNADDPQSPVALFNSSLAD